MAANPVDLGIVQKVSNEGVPAIAASSDLVVPAGKQWDVKALQVSLTSDATVGNRRLSVSLYDGSQLIYRYYAGLVQAASLAWAYVLIPGAPLSAAVVVDMAYMPLPSGLVMGPGYKIKVADQAAIAAATDTFFQSALVRETSV